MTEIKTSEMEKALKGPHVDVNTISQKKGVWTARRMFFYTHGYTSEKFAEAIRTAVKAHWNNRYVVNVIEQHELWKPFIGGAPVAKQSHWLVKFAVVPNNEMVEVVHLLSRKTVLIRAYDVGGCCDPSTETYHCM